MAFSRGDYGATLHDFEQALHVAHALGDRRGKGLVLIHLSSKSGCPGTGRRPSPG